LNPLAECTLPRYVMYVAHTAWILIDLDCSGFWLLKEKTEAFFWGGGGFPLLNVVGFCS
jgi:hypothetical protein